MNQLRPQWERDLPQYERDRLDRERALGPTPSQAVNQPPTITPAMIERSAKELCPYDWGSIGDEYKNKYRSQAEAALRAALEGEK